MPKSKPRKSPKAGSSAGPAYGANIGKPSRNANRRALIGVVLLALAGGIFWWQSGREESVASDGFAALVEAGQPALARVRTPAPQGQEHLDAGENKTYVEPFPTSGDHAPQGVKAGFYETEVPKINLVHALEHGNVVIYFDTPGEVAVATLKDWTSRFAGPWDGVVATRSPGLGEALVLTAWARSLRMNSFDAAEGAAFVDAFRGRGPENRVR